MSKLEELERRFEAHKQVRAGAYNWQNFAEVLLAALRESEQDNARLRAAIETIHEKVQFHSSGYALEVGKLCRQALNGGGAE